MTSSNSNHFPKTSSPKDHTEVYGFNIWTLKAHSLVCSEFWTIKKKSLSDLDNNDDTVTHLESDILEYEVKQAIGDLTTNKVSGGDGIPAELFQILKDDAAKVLCSICQQI